MHTSVAGEGPVLWAISSGQPDLLARARLALAAGLDRLLIRELELPDRRGLERLVADFPGRVVLHARMPDGAFVAAELGLGLHLASDALTGSFRERWAWPLGQSCHTPAEVRDALEAGCDWAFLSPIFAPISKPDDRRLPLGPAALYGSRAVALGGITVTNAAECVRSGAVGVASMSGILSEPSPGRAVRRWRGAIRRAA